MNVGGEINGLKLRMCLASVKMSKLSRISIGRITGGFSPGKDTQEGMRKLRLKTLLILASSVG